MLLTERHIIKKSNSLFKELDRMSFQSKNLYNQTLYRVRQFYFQYKKYLRYEELAKQLANEKQVDYISLPAKVAQQVLKQVDHDFKSFFGSLKSKKIKHKVSIPKYLKKDGRNLLTFTKQAISIKELDKGYLKLSGCKNKIKTSLKNIHQVRITPENVYFVLEIIYNKEEKEYIDTGSYVGIDIGLNNLAMIGGNKIKSVFINGRPLKAINQYYNKILARLKSRQEVCKNRNVNSAKLNTLSYKRYTKIKDYLHKESRKLVNHLVSNNVSKVVIGHNKDWKQDINLGKKNNQNFVQVPFSMFIQMVTYKSQLEGIEVVQREESYTSKCSFLDSEEICKHETYMGKRIKRGLFRSNNGRLINADLNGALNILRKEIPNAFNGYGIEVCSMPVDLSTKHLVTNNFIY
jgi:putative transposase